MRVESDPGQRRTKSLSRILAVKIILVLCFLGVSFRLVQIQVLESARFMEIARRQYDAKVLLPATRGNIYDRNGKILVSNSTVVSFAADPKIVAGDINEVADRFARVFGKPREVYRERLNAPNRRFVWLERKVSPAFARRVNASEFEGVIEMNESRRIYHYEHVGGQLVGFTDIDNKGLSGAEQQFDAELMGTNGYVIMQRDGLGRKRPSVNYPRVEPVNGHNIVLTIDLDYQAIAEEQLRKGIERNKAESGLVVMLEPATGEVLAMANYPPIDPNDLAGVSQSIMKNRVITDAFEPGSVFKLVTVSAALEHHLVKPEQKFFAENGSYVVKLPGGRARTITDTHPYGVITFQEAFEHSSNIVMAKVSELIGAEILYTTARNFGFGTPTGIELQGEVSGELKKPTRWSGTTLNSLAYGYEVTVTPLQLASAYAAVANKGILMKPYVLKQLTNEHGEVLAETAPQTIRRVISQSTADLITRFMNGVVQNGTGVEARMEMMPVAGKTGTSRTVVDGKYELGRYTASFAGFLPADDPKVVCVVMLNNPRAGGYTGGMASAPIFRNIAEKLVTISDRFSPTKVVIAEGKEMLAVPDVSSLQSEIATEMLESDGFDVEVQGNGMVVRGQSPSPGTKIPRGGVVKLQLEEQAGKIPEGFVDIPDVKGMTIRRALNRLTLNHLDVAVDGSGMVRAQSPPAGQRVRTGTRVTVRCEPKSVSMTALY